MKYILIVTLIMLSHHGYSQLINPTGKTLQQRVTLPTGYTRVSTAAGSFGAYLQNMPLLPNGSMVHYYNGQVKPNNGIYVAVVDMNIGTKDLQQCADVIMHARAEYLYKQSKRDKIHFTLTSGFVAYYSKWKDGYRMEVKGNKVSWVKKQAAGDSYASFMEYMDMIYTYCGTLSMSRELKAIKYEDIQPGDVLIKGGSPGHAELVMDVAKDKQGNKIYLLAQSYMPAQQMQILANPKNRQFSPWYEAKGSTIFTPEWDFISDQVMRFVE